MELVDVYFCEEMESTFWFFRMGETRDFFDEELPLESSPEPAILLFLIFRVHESSLSSSGCWEQVK
ncbi:RNA-binding protein with multiple splicing isoform 2 [Corchorus olitorius]|uniref:RNA-binding protein with multiple splicing isoform 2 n=1 Tax=Corchorus olitorius TaxID=93759 RepID=A0A1R3KCU4_9ROSI|nr:RNA-binding protein with multiple splicing isoform 2 [Corchorus olitorius]